MNLFPMIETAISSYSRVPHNPQRSNFAWVARVCAVDLVMSEREFCVDPGAPSSRVLVYEPGYIPGRDHKWRDPKHLSD